MLGADDVKRMDRVLGMLEQALAMAVERGAFEEARHISFSIFNLSQAVRASEHQAREQAAAAARAATAN